MQASPDISNMDISTLSDKRQWNAINNKWKKLGPLDISRL